MRGRSSRLVGLVAVGSVAALVASIPIAALAGLRINTSPSLPRGLYRQIAIRGGLRRGDLVLACPPEPAARLARMRGYLPPGPCPGGVEPVGKTILATSGERIEVRTEGIVRDGVLVPRSRPLLRDALGRPLPNLIGQHFEIGPGQIWLLAGRHLRSFDSRVFGPVPATAVLSRLVPLWVERDADFRMRNLGGSH